MQQKPKISVIVPVYKVEKYLKQCIDSVTSQTYKNLEIILVDDGSPDSCPKMCDDSAKTDERIRVIHKKNGGLSSARNAGLYVATGQYVFFLDSDDYIEPETLDTMLQAIQENYSDIVIAGVTPFYVGNKKPKSFDGMVKYFKVDRPQTKMKPVDVLSLPVVAWGKLYKKSIIDQYDLRFDEGLTAEDEGFNWYYNTKIKSGVFIPNRFYNYLIRADSIMANKQNKGDKIGDNLIILDKVHDHLIQHKLLKVYKSKFRKWANRMIQITYNLAQEFKKEELISECEKRYLKDGYKFTEKLFSIKHSLSHEYKFIYLFGIRIKIKTKKK